MDLSPLFLDAVPILVQNGYLAECLPFLSLCRGLWTDFNTFSVAARDNSLPATFLQRAAAMGNAQRVAFLLRCGADPCAVTRRSPQPPLHHAAHRGSAACAELLLQGGARRYAAAPTAAFFRLPWWEREREFYKDGSPRLLHCDIKQQSVMLKQGPPRGLGFDWADFPWIFFGDPLPEGSKPQAPVLAPPSGSGCATVAEVLKRHFPARKPAYSFTAAQAAQRAGHALPCLDDALFIAHCSRGAAGLEQAARALFSWQQDADAQAMHWPGPERPTLSTPLCAAAGSGCLPLLQQLLQHGAHPFKASPAGQLPLHAACTAGSLACAMALLQAIPSCKPSSRSTGAADPPSAAAAALRQSVNLPCSRHARLPGATPLMLAARGEGPGGAAAALALAAFLLAQGADPLALSPSTGSSAFSHALYAPRAAAEADACAVLQLLLEAAPEAELAAQQEAPGSGGGGEALRQQLELDTLHGVLNAPRRLDGLTPVQLAKRRGWGRAAALLVAAGARDAPAPPAPRRRFLSRQWTAQGTGAGQPWRLTAPYGGVQAHCAVRELLQRHAPRSGAPLELGAFNALLAGAAGKAFLDAVGYVEATWRGPPPVPSVLEADGTSYAFPLVLAMPQPLAPLLGEALNFGLPASPSPRRLDYIWQWRMRLRLVLGD